MTVLGHVTFWMIIPALGWLSIRMYADWRYGR
jgi:hypothetical protein